MHQTVTKRVVGCNLNLLPERINPVAFIDGDTVIKESRNLPVNHPARIAMDRCFHPPAEELYDLAVDPVEFKNLAAIPKCQERQKFLRRQLLKWRQQTAALNPAVLAAMVQQH